MTGNEKKLPMGKARFLFLSLMAVVCLSFGAILLYQIGLEACGNRHVREAETKAISAVAHRSTEFAEFIDARKSGVKAFSQEIISLYGKWRVVKSYLPFADGDGHKKYIIEKFDEHIFSQKDLSSAIQRSIEESLKDLDGIENELAVAVRQELLGRSLSPDEMPLAADEFRKATRRIIEASQWDAAKAAGQLVVSEIVSTIGTQIFIRLGVSSAILATSAANSWWSFGSSVLIGLVVDSVWEWYDDPAGDIEREMITALDNLSSNGARAINDELLKIVAERRERWNKTVSRILP